MKKFIRPIILLLFITASAFIGFAETGIDYSQVGEDIEVMAKVIDKTIQKEFPDEARVGSPFFSRGFVGCQGIYLKGYGAIFMTSIGFPVAEKVSQDEERLDDLWQQAKSELAGTGGRGYGSSVGEYNSERVEKLKEKLLEIIGTYGSNIRQLGSHENIVVAVQGTSSPSAPFIPHTEANLVTPQVHIGEVHKSLIVPEPNDVLAPESVVPSEPVISGKEIPAPEELERLKTEREVLVKKADEAKKQFEVQLKEVQKNIAKQQKEYEKAINAYRLIGMPEVSGRNRTTLIIKVSNESIMAYKNKGIDLDKFLKQAEIMQY